VKRPQVECPACHKGVTLHSNGRLYRHFAPGGGKCVASGAEPAQFAAAAGGPREADCVYCYRTVKLRQTGAPEVVGTLWKHRVPDDEGMAQWCQGGGELPVPANDNSTPGLSGFAGVVTEALGWGFEEKTPEPREAELTEWWHRLASRETRMVVRKAIEYGATDLRDIGRDIYEMAGRAMPDDATATETGIAFYIRGKIARAIAAIKEGRQPSPDTWHDVGIYARMAQRVQETGGWPGTIENDDDY